MPLEKRLLPSTDLCDDTTGRRAGFRSPGKRRATPTEKPYAMHRPPQKLPDPWLFDSEALLRELDRCREQVLQIPITNPQATHFAINNAVSAIWNLSQTIRYLLHLHREGQRAFAAKSEWTPASAAKAQRTLVNAVRDSGQRQKASAANQRTARATE